MSELLNNLELLKKTDVVPKEELKGYGVNTGSSDCNNCHYISSDCNSPCFC